MTADPICASPVPFGRLVDLWAGELPEPEAASVEEHVFACEACGCVYERLGALVGRLREAVPPVISSERLARLRAAGRRVVVTPVTPDVDARARFAPGLDYLVHALQADLAGAERVDVEVLHPSGETFLVVEGAPFDRDKGEVLIACQRHYEHLRPAGTDPTFCVHAWKDGQRGLIGRYLVIHEWR